MQSTVYRPRLSLSGPKPLRGLHCQALFGKKARSNEETDKQPRKAHEFGLIFMKQGSSVSKWHSKSQTQFAPDASFARDGQNWFSRQVDALDFAQTRSEGDRQSIDKAKLRLSGKLKAGKGEDQGKMSREEYAALRRKIGGTAKDYWKDFIQADEVESVKSSGVSSSVQGVPILLAVLAGLVVVTGVVVSQTSGQDPAKSPEQASAAQAVSVASQ